MSEIALACWGSVVPAQPPSVSKSNRHPGGKGEMPDVGGIRVKQET